MSDYSNMSRFQSSKGFVVVKTTAATPALFYGFQVVTEATFTTLAAPTSPGHEATQYLPDNADLAGLALPPGYYPIRGSSVTLASGAIILYLE